MMRHLNRRKYRLKKYRDEFIKNNPVISKEEAFNAGFNNGYTDAIKWVMRKLKCDGYTDLKIKLKEKENGI